MRHITVLIYFFCQLCFKSYSQEVRVGAQVPDLTLQHVINAQEKKLKLSDFKGKLIILDFWGIYCSSCVAAFPELDSIQKEYKNKIQIIAVNNETQTRTLKFFKTHKNIKLPDIPFVTGDTLLSLLFPHIYIPHHVWIDSNRIARFITAGYNTTSKSVSKFLNGVNIKLSEKRDVLDFKFGEPFIVEGNGRWLDKVLYYSYIMHHISGVNTGDHREVDSNGNVHVYMTSTALDFFRTCMGKWSPYKFLARNEIELRVKNPERFYPPENVSIDNWNAKFYFIYDLFLPKAMEPRLYSIMQQDLERFFCVRASVERKKIKCLALIRTSKNDKIFFTKEKSQMLHKAMIADSLWGEWNTNVSDFVTLLNLLLSRASTFPVVDETNYTKRICIGMDKQKIFSKNINLIRNELKNYDLDLVDRYEIRDVLVIKDD